MSTETIMKYDSPAESYIEALPIGNGRIGAMISGTPDKESITLNEDSFWSGGLRHRINPDAVEGFREARSLLLEGKPSEAEKAAFAKMQGVTPNMRRYMPLGELKIDLRLDGRAREYSRSLDIGSAVADASFTVNGITYTKEYFVSAPDEVMAVRISASEPGKVSLLLHRQPRGSLRRQPSLRREYDTFQRRYRRCKRHTLCCLSRSLSQKRLCKDRGKQARS